MSVHTRFESDCMNTFSANGRKLPFSVILRPLEGQNLANMGQKRINIWHSHKKCVHAKFALDSLNIFSGNGQKPLFSANLLPLEGQNWANGGQKWITSEHSPNKCIHEIGN